MISTCRSDFPMLGVKVHDHQLVYLDSAATALKPQCVIDAMARFYSQEYGTVHRGVYQLATASTERYAEARKKVAGFIGAASPEELIFTKGTTEAINLVAASFGQVNLNLGDEVLVSEIAHHSNIVPWQLICQRRGAILKTIPVDENGQLVLAALENLMCGRTKLVAVGHVSNVMGVETPIKKVVEIAHRYGAKVMVDGAQAVPHQAVDVQELGVDFYAFSGHKLYGPTGIGVLYGRQELLEALPPYQGGGDMVESVTFAETTYNVLPYRFEAGTPNIAGALGLSVAIDYISQIGLSNIQKWEQELLKATRDRLQEIDGLRILGYSEHQAAIVSFDIEGIHPFDLATLLDLEGICVRSGHHCSQPTMNRFGVSATTRVSLALYNTPEEVDFLAQTIRSTVARLRK